MMEKIPHAIGKYIGPLRSLDKFLLAVESRDLSQADKSIIRGRSQTTFTRGGG